LGLDSRILWEDHQDKVLQERELGSRIARRLGHLAPVPLADPWSCSLRPAAIVEAEP
jgi:hypothetical protein